MAGETEARVVRWPAVGLADGLCPPNHAPLKPTMFLKLPLGSIRTTSEPRGSVEKEWTNRREVAAQTGVARPRGMSDSVFHWSNPLPFAYTEGQIALRTEVRDPCIVRDGDRYYLILTMWPFSNREINRLERPNQGGSPGIALYSSKDLATWKFENWLVKSADLPIDCPYKNRCWAPEIHKLGGKFYLIFTADNWIKKSYNPAGSWGTAGHAFVGVSDTVKGPYRHISFIDGGACDTTLFEDPDGKTYAFIPRGSIDVQQIDLNQLENGKVRLVGKAATIATADNRDIGLEARPEYLEGPWVEKMGETYVLFYAEIYKDPRHPDLLGYRTGAAYANHPLGPWTKDPRGQVFFGGHLTVFPGPDGRRWFAYRGESRREHQGLLCVDPFDMDATGRVRCGAPAWVP